MLPIYRLDNYPRPAPVPGSAQEAKGALCPAPIYFLSQTEVRCNLRLVPGLRVPKRSPQTAAIQTQHLLLQSKLDGVPTNEKIAKQLHRCARVA